jgi:LPXTG-motif cell wall-anchored protein
MKFRSILFFAFIVLILSACSLADDITPPPDYQSPVPQPTMQATALATEVDTIPAPTATSGTHENATGAATGTPGEIIGAISGKITNKSGGSVPANMKVVLHVFQHDTTGSQFNEIQTQETSANADGTYSFANVSMPATQVFYVSVDYAGTTYESTSIVPTAGQTAYDLPVDIYETTTDASGLFADQLHVILDYSQPDAIQVVEFYIISNPGTKTVIPAKKGAAIVTASLPKGYTSLQFQDGQLGDRYIQTADGFGDTLPVPPGSQKYQLVFAFNLPYSANFDFVEPMPLNVSSITFLVSEGVKADAPGIVDGGLKDMGNGGGKYQLYTLSGRKAGESMKVSVSGAPGQAASTPPATGTDSTRNIIIGVGALGLALILAGGWLFWRDRKRAPVKEILSEEESNSDEIIDAIIALDDQYKAGNIAAEAYQQRRAELKERFKRIESSE